MNELQLVDWLKARAGGIDAGGTGLVLGIGDDCAIFRPRPGEDLLFTTDQLIEGVHFTAGLPAARIGERVLARNLSDLAAMGAEPRFCLVNLAIDPSRGAHPEAWIKAFFGGLLRLAKRTGAVLAGGDLAHSPVLHCDATVCGAVPRGKALRRDGARPGDSLYVSGRLGKPWDRPIRPRLALGRELLGQATACIDVSDGLALDLHRLCRASGVAAELDRIPVVRGASLDRALHGGEDYELLFTMPSAVKPPKGTTRIGSIVEGTPGEVHFQGGMLAPRGYDHLSAGL